MQQMLWTQHMQAYQSVLTISHMLGIACYMLDESISLVMLNIFIVIFYLMLIVFGVYFREPPSYMMEQRQMTTSPAAQTTII